jgi:hypothetical protein
MGSLLRKGSNGNAAIMGYIAAATSSVDPPPSLVEMMRLGQERAMVRIDHLIGKLPRIV